MRSELAVGKSNNRIMEEVAEYKTRLTNAVNNELAETNIVQLAHEGISHWLMKCDLDFQQ